MLESDGKEHILNPLVVNSEKRLLSANCGSLNSFISVENREYFDKVMGKYNMKMRRKKVSKEDKLVDELKKKIKAFLKCYPDGLQLEKFSSAYQQYFGTHLDPRNYKYENVVDLLTSCKLEDTVALKTLENDVIIVHAGTLDETSPSLLEVSAPELSSQYSQKEIPQDIVQTFEHILTLFGGGIPIDRLLPEYEFRSGKKINFQELGISSLYELISLMKEFKVCSINDSQFFLYKSEKNLNSPGNDKLLAEIKEEDSKGSVDKTSSYEGRFLNKETCMRLFHILIDEFPEGLSLEELEATYKGFFGAYCDDLDPSKYGLRTLESLLLKESGLVRLLRQHGNIMAVADSFCQEGFQACGKRSSPKTVNFSASYEVLDSDIFSEREFVDVVVADVYSPSKFWIIKRGKENSEALDDLMDRMLAFYESGMGKRFLIPKEDLVLTFGAPVAALYEEDLNFYRAIVICMEDVRTVKLFFIDYGTNVSVPISSLRYLHEIFFHLPAQAIKCSLYGVEPADGRSFWAKSVTSEFLKMVQDKVFAAYINESQGEGKLYLTLYDTSQDHDVDINGYLVSRGMANYKKDTSMIFASKNKHLNRTRTQHLEGVLVSSEGHDRQPHWDLALTQMQEKTREETQSEWKQRETQNDGKQAATRREEMKGKTLKFPEEEINEDLERNCEVGEKDSFQRNFTLYPSVNPFATSMSHPYNKFVLEIESKDSESDAEEPLSFVWTDVLSSSPKVSTAAIATRNQVTERTENGHRHHQMIMDSSCSLTSHSSKRKREPFFDSEKIPLQIEDEMEDEIFINLCRKDKSNDCYNGEEASNGQELSCIGMEASHSELKFPYNGKRATISGDRASSHEQELFFSDDEESLGKIISTQKNESLIPISLSSDNIHLILIDSCSYLPIPELPSIIEEPTLTTLNGELVSEPKDGRVVEINRDEHFHVFMMLARERVPYLFPSVGPIPTTLTLLSLPFLFEFMRSFASHCIQDTFCRFVKLALEVLPQDPLFTSQKRGMQSHHSESCHHLDVLSMNRKATAVSTFTSLNTVVSVKEQPSQFYLWRTKSLPSYLNLVDNDEVLNKNFGSITSFTEKEDFYPDSRNFEEESNFCGYFEDHFTPSIISNTSVEERKDHQSSSSSGNFRKQNAHQELSSSSSVKNLMTDNSTQTFREEVLVNVTDYSDEDSSKSDYYTPSMVSPNVEFETVEEFDNENNARRIEYLRTALSLLKNKRRSLKGSDSKMDLQLSQEIERYENSVADIETSMRDSDLASIDTNNNNNAKEDDDDDPKTAREHFKTNLPGGELLKTKHQYTEKTPLLKPRLQSTGKIKASGDSYTQSRNLSSFCDVNWKPNLPLCTKETRQNNLNVNMNGNNLDIFLGNSTNLTLDPVPVVGIPQHQNHPKSAYYPYVIQEMPYSSTNLQMRPTASHFLYSDAYPSRNFANYPTLNSSYAFHNGYYPQYNVPYPFHNGFNDTYTPYSFYRPYSGTYSTYNHGYIRPLLPLSVDKRNRSKPS